MATVEFVQCELWRGGEGTSASVFAALWCWWDEVHWHGEGTVHLLSRGLCRSVFFYHVSPPLSLFKNFTKIIIGSLLSPVLLAPSPSLPPAPVGMAPLGANMVVVLGISLCLAVILVTIMVTVWRKLCKTPQCSSVRRGSMHSPGGRKLSDEASIFGHSLQRPSVSDAHGPLGGTGVSVTQKDPSLLGNQQTLVIPVSQDPDRLSPTGQKMLPTVFGYIMRLYLHHI